MKKIFVAVLILIMMIFSAPVFADPPITAYNTTLTMTAANTEYDLALPNGIGAITILCRGNYDVKVSFTNGASGTTYFTIKSGSVYYEENISSYNNSIHVQCATAGQILEIIYWM